MINGSIKQSQLIEIYLSVHTGFAVKLYENQKMEIVIACARNWATFNSRRPIKRVVGLSFIGTNKTREMTYDRSIELATEMSVRRFISFQKRLQRNYGKAWRQPKKKTHLFQTLVCQAQALVETVRILHSCWPRKKSLKVIGPEWERQKGANGCFMEVATKV